MGCGLSKAHSTRRFSCPTVMPALTVPRSAADRPAAIRPAWPKAHIAAAMGDLAQVREDAGSTASTPKGEAGLHDRSSRPHRRPTQDQPRGRGTRSSSCAAPSAVGRTGSVPSLACRPGPRQPDPAPPPKFRAWCPGGRPTGEVILVIQDHGGPLLESHPGELVHMDVKKMGRITRRRRLGGPGREKRSSARQKEARSRFDFLHSLHDDQAAWRISRSSRQEGPRECPVLQSSRSIFAGLGITRIEGVMTDNATIYNNEDARR